MAIALLVASLVVDVLVAVAAAYLLVRELMKRPWSRHEDGDGTPPQDPGGERVSPPTRLAA
ncbi:MAG: hypothetical protein M3N52_09950 [Actinomycetota bacterium]|nr:hypothetical protein [Actinomycetota bacterium]